jgi:hypothetical protein
VRLKVPFSQLSWLPSSFKEMGSLTVLVPPPVTERDPEKLVDVISDVLHGGSDGLVVDGAKVTPDTESEVTEIETESGLWTV